jgi:hypothetical protein
MQALALVGPTSTLISPNADVEETINFYVEPTAPGTGKVPAYLVGTPGLIKWLVLPDAPVRGMFEQDGRCFAVAGSSLFELFTGQTATFRGSVASDTNLATFASNGSAGHQLAITSGGLFYIFDLNANTLTLVTTGIEPVTMVEFMDGYFLVNKTNSRTFAFSALEDGTTWDPLDVDERSEASDNIVAMVRSHRELWFLGSQTTEVWYDQGDPLNPFAPIQGVFIEQGCGAAFTAQRIDNSIMWAGLNVDGSGVVWKANGYTPQRISDYAVELGIQTYGLSGARAWVYQEDGHLFYVLLLPNAPWAFAYDISSGTWCKRAKYDSTHCVWTPPVAQTHAYAFGKHLVGARDNGAIFDQSLSYYTEEVVTA